MCNRIVDRRPVNEPVPVGDDIDASTLSTLGPEESFIRRSHDDVIVADFPESHYSPFRRQYPDPPINERVSREDAAGSSARRRRTFVGDDIAGRIADPKSPQTQVPYIAIDRRWMDPRSTDFRRTDTKDSMSPSTRHLTRGSSLNVKETATMAAMRPRLLARRSVSLNVVSTSISTTRPRLATTFPADTTTSQAELPSLKSTASEAGGHHGNSVYGVARRLRPSKSVVSPKSLVAGKSLTDMTKTTQINGRLQWKLLPKSVLDAITAAESEESVVDEVTPKASTLAIDDPSWSGGNERNAPGVVPVRDERGLKPHTANTNDKSGSGEDSTDIVTSKTARIYQSVSDPIVVPIGTRGQHQCGGVDDLPTLIGKTLSFDNDDSRPLNCDLSEYCPDVFITESLQSGATSVQLPQQQTSLERCTSWDCLMIDGSADFFDVDPCFENFLPDDHENRDTGGRQTDHIPID